MTKTKAPISAKKPKDPIANIEWLHTDELKANDYNPNMVFSPELKLLERSILLTGWVQPVLVSRDMVIIDGFHRWMLSQESKEIRKRYGGLLPVAVLDVDRKTAMILTVRMNRAKGSHAAVKMSDMVHELLSEHKMAPADLAAEIGATLDEIELLNQEGVFSMKNTKDYKYSKAWYPKNVKKERAK